MNPSTPTALRRPLSITILMTCVTALVVALFLFGCCIRLACLAVAGLGSMSHRIFARRLARRPLFVA